MQRSSISRDVMWCR